MMYRRLFSLSSRALSGVIAALFLLVSIQPAQAQLGESTALFLRIEPDSRSAGMGNTGVAVADNANAIFWNPAGLAFQEDTQVGLTHANWLPEFDAGLFYEYAVGTYHAEGIGTFGGHITYLNLGDIEVRNDAGLQLNVERSYEVAIGASYGRKISERFGVGGSTRFIYSKLSPDTEEVEDGQASTVAVDLASLYRTAPFELAGTPTTFSAGLNIANIGGGMTYNEDKQAMPTTLRLGYALTFDFDEYNSLTLANDYTKQLSNVDLRECNRGGSSQSDAPDVCTDPDTWFTPLFTSWSSQPGEADSNSDPELLSVAEQITMGVGVEYWYSGLFALRTGYYYENPKNGNREFLNFGAGLRYNIVGVDISYIYTLEENNPLANTLRFSVLLNFR